jgi:hypothetical protein
MEKCVTFRKPTRKTVCFKSKKGSPAARRAAGRRAAARSCRAADGKFTSCGGRGSRAAKLPAGWYEVGDSGEYKKHYAKDVLHGIVVKYGKKYEGYFTAQGRTGFPAIAPSTSPAKIARELDKIVKGYRSPASAAAALRQSSRY